MFIAAVWEARLSPSQTPRLNGSRRLLESRCRDKDLTGFAPPLEVIYAK